MRVNERKVRWKEQTSCTMHDSRDLAFELADDVFLHSENPRLLVETLLVVLFQSIDARLPVCQLALEALVDLVLLLQQGPKLFRFVRELFCCELLLFESHTKRAHLVCRWLFAPSPEICKCPLDVSKLGAGFICQHFELLQRIFVLVLKLCMLELQRLHFVSQFLVFLCRKVQLEWIERRETACRTSDLSR